MKGKYSSGNSPGSSSSCSSSSSNGGVVDDAYSGGSSSRRRRRGEGRERRRRSEAEEGHNKRAGSDWGQRALRLVRATFKAILAFIKRHRKTLSAASYAVLGVLVVRVIYRARARARRRAAQIAMSKKAEVPFSEFLNQVKAGDVTSVYFSPQLFKFYEKNGTAAKTTRPLPGNVHRGIVDTLLENGVSFEKAPPAKLSWLPSALVFMVPFIYLGGCGMLLYKYFNDSMGGDVGKQLQSGSAGRDRGRGAGGTTFDDVAGIDAAKQVVWEVSDFIKYPQKYRNLGARLPTGVLLVGPPGTGKTMLARAIANDAGVAFLYCSGSDFVEVFAGRGAGRVRRLFQRARKRAPCIVFFDEIDALGKKRTDIGMNEEREQTLNQILAEMDGFSARSNAQSSPVLVIAATNRYDVLDSALTRPGRFDRVVRVELPSVSGREEILRVHTRDKNLAAGTDLQLIAEITPKFSGADLAMIVNEAAISAARSGRMVMRTEDFLGAVDAFKTSRCKKKADAGSSIWAQLASSMPSVD